MDYWAWKKHFVIPLFFSWPMLWTCLKPFELSSIQITRFERNMFVDFTLILLLWLNNWFLKVFCMDNVNTGINFETKVSLVLQLYTTTTFNQLGTKFIKIRKEKISLYCVDHVFCYSLLHLPAKKKKRTMVCNHESSYKQHAWKIIIAPRTKTI